MIHGPYNIKLMYRIECEVGIEFLNNTENNCRTKERATVLADSQSGLSPFRHGFELQPFNVGLVLEKKLFLCTLWP